MTEVRVIYLEQRDRPRKLPHDPPRETIQVVRLETVPVHFYRYLYHHVGEAWGWRDRHGWSDLQLDARLKDPKVEIHVLYVGGVPAGYAELDRTQGHDCELRLFGLMPEFLGRGLGPFFLGQMLDHAWSGETHRVHLSTCSLDHPGALNMYLRFGFVIYREEMTQPDQPAETAAAD